VTKRKISFALMLMLVMAGLIVAMLPAAAVAAPGIVEVNVSEATFEGFDTFYNANVVAYTPGSTAKMEFRVSNDGTVDLNITAAKVVFSWGTCTPAVPATFPFVLKAGGYAEFRFECAIPADVSNQTLHQYKIWVHYEPVTGPTVVNKATSEAFGDLVFNNAYAVPGSVVLYDVTATAANVIPAEKYTVNYYTGVVTWVAPYAPAGSVYASYEYIGTWVLGDGVNKVFRFETTETSLPIVDGSVKVCKRIDAGALDTVAKVDTGWTVDLATGTVTFTDAPASWEYVGVFYKRSSSFVSSGSLAVVSQDQADYTALWRRYKELYDSEYYGQYITGSAQQQWGEAEAARMKAEIQYREGKFADAKASMQIALDKETAAIAAETSMYTTVQNGLTGLLTSAQPVVDAYAAKLDAEAKMAKGQASMYKNVGVFTIMLGVATLLAGLAGLLWAYSRLVAAKGPKAG
jgi:hypothetical protein